MRLASSAIASLVLALALAGCGEPNPQIILNISQDGSQPCLGAGHIELNVITDKGVFVYHEFGQFFDATNHSCVFGKYSFPDLPFGEGIQVAILLWDSTSDAAGNIASGSSVPIDVKAGSADTQLEVTVTRKSGVALGTIIIRQPADWQAISGTDRLQYRITPDGDEVPIRSGFFSYAPDERTSTFPLIVSSLPIPDVLTGFEVEMESYRGDTLLRRWTAWAYIGPSTNPSFVQPSSQ